MRNLITLLLIGVLLGLTGTAVAAPGNSRNFTAHLNGEDSNVDTQAQGQAIFHVSKNGSSIQYKLIVANIENVRMAHIHLAPAGVDGPVVTWLYPDGPPPVEIPGRFSGVLAEGTIEAGQLTGPLAGQPLQALIDAIAAGNTYVNVHTAANPGGEIRGQIK